MADCSTLLQEGINLIQRGTAADHAGEYEEALRLYSTALEYLLSVMRLETNERIVSTLRPKVREYMARAEKLKHIVETSARLAETPSTPVAPPTSSAAPIPTAAKPSKQRSSDGLQSSPVLLFASPTRAQPSVASVSPPSPTSTVSSSSSYSAAFVVPSAPLSVFPAAPPQPVAISPTRRPPPLTAGANSVQPPSQQQPQSPTSAAVASLFPVAPSAPYGPLERQQKQPQQSQSPPQPTPQPQTGDQPAHRKTSSSASVLMFASRPQNPQSPSSPPSSPQATTAAAAAINPANAAQSHAQQAPPSPPTQAAYSGLGNDVCTALTPSQQRKRGLTIPISCGQTGCGYERLFGCYLAGAKRVAVDDPYVRTPYQVAMFLRFVELVAKEAGGPVTVELTTTRDPDVARAREQEIGLREIADDLTAYVDGSSMALRFADTVHERRIVITNENGSETVIRCSRGLDIYQQPEDHKSKYWLGRFDLDLRKCLESTIDIFVD